MRTRSKNGWTVKAWNSSRDAFCAMYSNTPNVSFRNSPQCPIYSINSDKIKLSRNTPTEVALQFLPPVRTCAIAFPRRELLPVAVVHSSHLQPKVPYLISFLLISHLSIGCNHLPRSEDSLLDRSMTEGTIVVILSES